MKNLYLSTTEPGNFKLFIQKSFLSVAFIFLVNIASSQSIFTNPITDASPSSSNPFIAGQAINPNISVSGIGRGSGIGANAGANRYNANNWSTTTIDVNDYFEFTLAPNSGYLINFASFVYSGQVSAGTPTFKFRSSLDGFTADIGTATATGATINLSAAAYQNISAPITFRYFGYGFANPGTTYSINDFIFNGTVVAGPSLTAGALTDFGNICINTIPGANLFTLSGNSLTIANINVAALTGFTFSTDNITFTSSLNIAQLGGTFSQNIYVRFSPTLVQSYNGNIVINGGGAPAINVAVTGSGVNTKPTITNGTVSGITTNSANVSVTISGIGCSSISAYGVEYSVTPGFLNGTGTQVAGGVLSAGAFSSALTTLAPPGQTYYFHTYATNTGGTSYGAENSFTLLNTVPTLAVPPSGAGSLSPFVNNCINTTVVAFFNLSGSVLNGSNIVIGALSGYKYSINPGGPFTNSVTLVNGGSGYSYAGGTLSATIYVQFGPTLVQSYNGNILVSGGGATSINISASGNGVNDISTLSTGNAVFITTTGAILPGTILTPGCGVLLDYGIEYSTTAGFLPGTGTQVSASNLSSGNFSVTLSTLLPGTNYYYYAYATTAGGTGYGSPQNSFSTLTSPTKLVITSISPASPTALTPFTITITAVDNLISLNPTNVTSNTDVTLNQAAGINILTFPSIPVGTIPAGANSITIMGSFYDVPETGVGMTATASSGMTGLGTSNVFNFDVISYTGPNTFIWSANGNSAWLLGSNWQIGTAPGSSVAGVNQHLASFTSLAALNTSATGGCGINIGSVGGYNVGGIYFADTYNTTHIGDIVPIGNSSTTVSDTLTMHGILLNTVGGISGNNYSSLFIANYMSSATTKTLEIRNGIGSGNRNLTLRFAAPGSIVAAAGRTINLNLVLVGTQPLTLTGGGIFSFKPSGSGASNAALTGAITVANGLLLVGNAGAFSSITPNVITLGSSAANVGILRLDGNPVTIGGLNSGGTAGNANLVDNGSAAATLTLNNASSFIFKGALKNGSAGILTLVKTGVGSQTLQGLNTYTGLTTINGGAIILAHPGGATLASTNSVVVNGSGTLQVSSDQTIKDLTLATGGVLKIDAGVTLTITGVYNAATCNVINNGTIKLQGTALQTFPGTAATVSAMNNLTINNLFGVNLNNSLNIAGTLNLNAGAFTVGAYTLTINNPVTGTLANFSANNTSSIVIAGTASGVDIPSAVSQLKALTVSNTAGSTLQGNLNISTTLFITNTAGTLNDNQFILNGAANVTMTGGILNLEQNTAVLPGLTGVYVLSAGTVVFNGVGVGTDAQTVRPVNYFNLTSAATGDRILSAAGIIGVSNVFTPNLPGNLYTVINSTVDYNKAAAQFVAGFRYYNMTVSGGGAFTKTLNGNINIRGTLTLATNTKFALANFNTTLKSDAANTANVAVITTTNSITYGTGQFVVERYIPTGIAHGKSWQLLSVPVSGAQSVKAAWQEGNAPLVNGLPGFGTTISSERAGAVGRGYDFYTAVAPSIKTYSPATNAWIGTDDGVTTTAALPIANKKGYMLFVRGDRSVQTSAAAANVTVLRTSGKLFSPGTDAPFSSIVPAGKFETVGNPYASAIDFTNLLTTSTGIDSKYYVWDPLLPGTNGLGYGGYQLLSGANVWKPIPGGTTNYPTGIAYTKVQSGQAFFAYSTAGGTVGFAEANKLSGSNMVYRQPVAGQRSFLRGWLHGATGIMADGNVVAFDPAYSNIFDADDAIKLPNPTGSFGIQRGDKILALEARNTIVNTDTVFYALGNLAVQSYQIRFAPENMDGTGLTAYFVDKFKGTRVPVSLADSTTIIFEITSDPLSIQAGRFYLVFKQAAPLPVRFINISAIRKGSTTIEVSWTVHNETGADDYEIERGGDGRNFTRIANSPATGNNGGSLRYTYTDNAPFEADNFYRIRAVNADGSVQYSPVAKIPSTNAVPAISIYPNPIVNKIINIAFLSQPAGNYSIQLSNKIGQVVYSNSAQLPGGNTVKTLSLGNEVASGIYQLRIRSANGDFSQQVLVK